MKKYIVLFFLGCLFLSVMNAQDVCENNLRKAQQLLKENSPFTAGEAIFKLVEPCALQGSPEAENYLGMLYLNGIGVAQNDQKAFTFFEKAAQKEYAKAQYNLGRMYKSGISCTLDFAKAIAWFTKATENGSQRAAYTLGYMYYKGLGVPQDYQKALYWFRNSDDHMAKHFLGLSYYQGYGVTADTDKALELLLSNPTGNSKTLIKYIQVGQKEKSEESVVSTLHEEDTNDPTQVAVEVITTAAEKLEVNGTSLPKDELTGEWIGKLVQYDWSGKKIERIFPIACSFTDGTQSGVAVTLSLLGTEQKVTALWQHETLYFKNPVLVTVDKLYSSNPKELTLNYGLLSMSLQKEEVAEKPYIIGNVDSFIEEWTEYGQPMSVVLRPKTAADQGTQETTEEDEMLLALAAQKDQFIKLYPVPFYEQLTIQYELKKAANVQVSLHSLYDTDRTVVVPSKVQEAGNHTHTLRSSLPSGLYIVRVIADDEVYTRLVIKKN